MFIVHVYPLMRGIAPAVLTYFSKEAYPRSAIIEVPVRKKMVPAIVADCSDARSLKSTLRKQNHQLTAIKAQTPRFPFSEALLSAAEDIARHEVTSVGALLYLFLNKSVPLEEAPISAHSLQRAKKHRPLRDLCALQAPQHERMAQLRLLVREKLAQEKSVLIVAPTQREVEGLYQALSDIPLERRVHLHHGLGKRLLRTALKRLEEERACLIVASPQYATYPRGDIGLIYLSGVLSPHFEHAARPVISFIPLFTRLGSHLGASVVHADTLLDVAAHEARAEGVMRDLLVRQHITPPTPLTIVDRRAFKKTTLQESPLAISTLTHMSKKLAEGRSFVVLSGRRGLSTGIACKECKQPVRCHHCSAPLVLIGPNATINTPHFFCRRCATREDSQRRCANCDSWNLEATGSGSELLAKKLAQYFPKEQVVRIDADSAKTPKQIDALMEQWQSTARILVTTERTVPLITTIEECVVANYDALLSAPDAQVGTRLLALLLDLREKTDGSVYLETRMPEHPVLTAATDGNVTTFLKEEAAMRTLLHFPPFGTLVRIVRTGKKADVQKDMARLKRVLAAYDPLFTPTWHHGVRGTMALIHLHEPRTPEPLLELLRSFPPTFIISIEDGTTFSSATDTL